VIDGVTMAVDAARVDAHSLGGTPQTWYSLNLVGWGLAIDATIKAEGMRCLGGSRYDIATFLEILKFNKRPCTLTLDGTEFSSDSMLIVMAQMNVHAGKGMVLAPSAKLDDGLVDVLHFDLKGKTRAQVLSLFSNIKAGGRHVYSKDCQYHRVKTLCLDSPSPTRVTIDGEGDTMTPLKLEVLSGAFDLFVPRSRTAVPLGMPNSIQPQRQGDVSDEHDVSPPFPLAARAVKGKAEVSRRARVQTL
jgi:diacylglycerol kinase family enzyme